MSAMYTGKCEGDFMKSTLGPNDNIQEDKDGSD